MHCMLTTKHEQHSSSMQSTVKYAKHVHAESPLQLHCMCRSACSSSCYSAGSRTQRIHCNSIYTATSSHNPLLPKSSSRLLWYVTAYHALAWHPVPATTLTIMQTSLATRCLLQQHQRKPASMYGPSLSNSRQLCRTHSFNPCHHRPPFTPCHHKHLSDSSLATCQSKAQQLLCVNKLADAKTTAQAVARIRNDVTVPRQTQQHKQLSSRVPSRCACACRILPVMHAKPTDFLAQHRTGTAASAA